jgi:NADH-quinone oxidoreductase subunit H
MQTLLDFLFTFLVSALQVLLFPGIFFIIGIAFLWQWLDRKFYARIQSRMGPLHTGRGGLLQPIMDFIKLLGKEDLTPAKADRRSFAIIPIIMLVLSLTLCMFLPIVNIDSTTSWPEGVLSFEGDLILILFLSALMTVTIILAGYFSSNPFGQAGAARTGMLMVTFEVPLIISFITPAMLTGSLKVATIMNRLGALTPTFAWLMILPFFIFLVSVEAELERIPFDVSHAETEIVHGWQVEYSGKKLAFITLTEDIMLFYAAGIATTLFLGGPFLLEFIPLPLFSIDFANFMANTWVGWIYYPLVFLLKSAFIVIILSNMRALFARWRIDQIVRTGWKFMTPLAIINLLLIQVALSYIFPVIGVV